MNFRKSSKQPLTTPHFQRKNVADIWGHINVCARSLRSAMNRAEKIEFASRLIKDDLQESQCNAMVMQCNANTKLYQMQTIGIWCDIKWNGKHLYFQFRKCKTGLYFRASCWTRSRGKVDAYMGAVAGILTASGLTWKSGKFDLIPCTPLLSAKNIWWKYLIVFVFEDLPGAFV